MPYFLLLALTITVTNIVATPPDGLCLLKGKEGGYGHGFIVDDTIFSAAHVLENADGTFLCYQDGVLISVDNLKVGPPKLHPQWSDLSKELKGLDPSQHSPKELNHIQWNAQSPYDMGYVKLKQKLKSNFVFHNNQEKRADNFIEVQVTPDDQNSNTLRTTRKFFSLTSKFDAERQIYLFKLLKDPQTSKIILHYDLFTSPGHSGAPLTVRLTSGKLLVMGFHVGGDSAFSSLPTNVPEYQDISPSYFSTSQTLWLWLNEEGQDLPSLPESESLDSLCPQQLTVKDKNT